MFDSWWSEDVIGFVDFDFWLFQQTRLAVGMIIPDDSTKITNDFRMPEQFIVDVSKPTDTDWIKTSEVLFDFHQELNKKKKIVLQKKKA